MPELSDALAAALQRVGDRWTLLVVAALLDGPKRFGELHAEVPGVATNVLTVRLRELERQGLVVSAPYSERPLRVEYQLTSVAAELSGALRLLALWGAGPGGGAEAPIHLACGTPLDLRAWCPTCQRLAEDTTKAPGGEPDEDTDEGGRHGSGHEEPNGAFDTGVQHGDEEQDEDAGVVWA